MCIFQLCVKKETEQKRGVRQKAACELLLQMAATSLVVNHSLLQRQVCHKQAKEIVLYYIVTRLIFLRWHIIAFLYGRPSYITTGHACLQQSLWEDNQNNLQSSARQNCYCTCQYITITGCSVQWFTIVPLSPYRSRAFISLKFYSTLFVIYNNLNFPKSNKHLLISRNILAYILITLSQQFDEHMITNTDFTFIIIHSQIIMVNLYTTETTHLNMLLLSTF